MDFDFAGWLEIRKGMSLWGPYEFDLTSLISRDETITSVTVLAYSGICSTKTDLSGRSIIPLIDDTIPIDTVDNKVSIYFQHPGSQYAGRASLVFSVVTDGGGANGFFFDRMMIS